MEDIILNKGLNRKSIYFTKQVGNSGTLIANISKMEGGIFLEIPLYETPGISKIPFYLNLNEVVFFK